MRICRSATTDHTDAAIRAEYAVTAPFYVGSINAAQRGRAGSVAGTAPHGQRRLLDIGPFGMPQRAAAPPAIAGIATACIASGRRRPRPRPRPNSRPKRARHRRLGPASSAAELSDGGLSEGEDRP